RRVRRQFSSAAASDSWRVERRWGPRFLRRTAGAVVRAQMACRGRTARAVDPEKPRGWFFPDCETRKFEYKARPRRKFAVWQKADTPLSAKQLIPMPATVAGKVFVLWHGYRTNRQSCQWPRAVAVFRQHQQYCLFFHRSFDQHINGGFKPALAFCADPRQFAAVAANKSGAVSAGHAADFE